MAPAAVVTGRWSGLEVGDQVHLALVIGSQVTFLSLSGGNVGLGRYAAKLRGIANLERDLFLMEALPASTGNVNRTLNI